MYDKQFLSWLHARLVLVHKEDINYDYMLKFRSIIDIIPEDQLTPNVSIPIYNYKLYSIL